MIYVIIISYVCHVVVNDGGVKINIMKFYLSFLFFFFSLNIFGQTCTIISKANNITPDKLCSPVSVVWNVSYTGVNDAGSPVSIIYDWNNGTVVTIPAIQVGPGIFQATASNTYTSRGDICNYHPQATLMVNGVLCTSSTQEQIVTVWDDDNHNGGHMHINPEVYPICFGNSANVRFQDLTQFNCVPPQERDNPNINTRWIQWIYGTDITMSGIPVTINGQPQTYPFRDRIITIPGPTTGSGIWSEIMNVANDKQIGEYFEVTLRNWNYCNPYDDPNIPGLPIDRENGDNPPVITTAIILIVPYPDAAIIPIDTLCANDDAVTLRGRFGDGVWTGTGVSGNTFSPIVAGPGNHRIIHTIISGEGCADSDTTFAVVIPIPNATILSKGIVCSSDSPLILSAVDEGGIWSGQGVVGNVFNPILAGAGNHTITYNITGSNGCSAEDKTILTVATPNATITPVDTLCVNDAPIKMISHDLGGIWTGPGIIDDIFHPEIAGSGNHLIKYNIVNADCKDEDSTIITVMPIPDITINSIGTIWLNSSPIALMAIPEGGIWSGPGIIDNIFYPKDAELGEHVITYTIPPDKWGCTNFDTIHVQIILPPTPIAYFEPDTVGCSPLTVHFRNKSLYGESYVWDFGDRVYSTEQNPVHTYYAPGNYIVRLTVYNIAGSSYHSGIITIFQGPVAIFTAYPMTVVNNEQVVVFSNDSYYDVTSLWDFGDGLSSLDENPYHKYENPGTYLVSLYVTSKDGCVDSTTLQTPIKVEWKTGLIKFPNAFKWNGSGPTGGYWQEGMYSEMDNIFRPHFENVIEYYLQIFNRWGVLIYESRDLHKGWDGYFEDGNLAIQGVYVWRVTGRYANGDYFEKVGDVTFLH